MDELYDPQPGDFAVVNTGTRTTALITGLERLDDLVEKHPLDWTDFDHAVIFTAAGKRFKDGRPGWLVQPRIVEAEPTGATERFWHYDKRPYMLSSGLPSLELTPEQRARAAAFARGLADARVGYGWLDYGALTLHALGLKTKSLQEFIRRTDRLICSQLVDYCRESVGSHLFSDGRWNGFVKPSDLGMLINQARKAAGGS